MAVDKRWPYRDAKTRLQAAGVLVAMTLIAVAFLVFTHPHLWDKHPRPRDTSHATVHTSR